MTIHEAIGKHLILDFFRCKPKLLDDAEKITKVLERAVIESGCEIIKTYVHRWQPQGITIIVVLGESHISYHSWPEFGSCFIDLFTCGNKADPEKAFPLLLDFFKPKRIGKRTILRRE